MMRERSYVCGRKGERSRGWAALRIEEVKMTCAGGRGGGAWGLCVRSLALPMSVVVAWPRSLFSFVRWVGELGRGECGEGRPVLWAPHRGEAGDTVAVCREFRAAMASLIL